MTDWRDVAARHRTLVRDANELVSANFEKTDYHNATCLFSCECDDPACGDTVRLTRCEYELARASPTRFVIMADHEDPQIEHLVAENARFAIVETLPGTTSRIALRSDPRAAR